MVIWMIISSDEKPLYFRCLRENYGTGIISEERFLDTDVQREFEEKRHRTNALSEPRITANDWQPGKVLLLPTQSCTCKCDHCWVFGTPDSECVLTPEQLRAIRANLTVDGKLPVVTVSGGEFFTHHSFREILADFPVQCIYTNGFWGYTPEKCHSYLQDVLKAVSGNTAIDLSKLTLILSYDHRHSENFRVPIESALAGIISGAYHIIPEANLRISQSLRNQRDIQIDPLIRELQAAGFTVGTAEKSAWNGSILTKSYSYGSHGKPGKTLYADFFPETRIGRAILRNPDQSPGGTNSHNKKTWWDDMPLSRHQYVIGPDAGLGIYTILYAPPVPYCAGNLVDMPWRKIEERLRCDPIATALQTLGLPAVWAYMDACIDTGLRECLLKNTQTIQQFMYLLVLEPERRLQMNLFLAELLHLKGIWQN